VALILIGKEVGKGESNLQGRARVGQIVVVVVVVVVGWLLIKSSIANGQNTKLGLLTTASCARRVAVCGGWGE